MDNAVHLVCEAPINDTTAAGVVLSREHCEKIWALPLRALELITHPPKAEALAYLGRIGY